ncbi:MAG: ion transporter [Oscillospiraceae bacterium]|nr:ion transporter [Oscillospiraceae bacterium]
MRSLPQVRQKIHEIINGDDKTLASSIFDGAVIALIAVNVALAVLETFQGLPHWAASVFHGAEIVITILFTAEYLLRLWTAPLLYPQTRPLRAVGKHALSFLAIVDLLSFLPFYIHILPFELRVLRMIRLLRLLRIFKMQRYISALSAIAGVFRRKREQLITSILMMVILLVISSILMYTVENPVQPEVFSNAFSGLWWSVATLGTVGSDIQPVTAAGRLLSTLITLLSVCFVAVPAAIISSGFAGERKAEREESSSLVCPHCGKEIER